MARAARGKPVPAANLHLTLAFLGEVDEARVGVLPALADAIETRAFRLDFDRVGSFPRAHVAWVGCAKAPAALIGLQAALARSLADGGFALEERAFAPHLTLARKTQGRLPARSIDPIGWRVEGFSLVRSRAGRYETAASWRLD